MSTSGVASLHVVLDDPDPAGALPDVHAPVGVEGDARPAGRSVPATGIRTKPGGSRARASPATPSKGQREQQDHRQQQRQETAHGIRSPRGLAHRTRRAPVRQWNPGGASRIDPATLCKIDDGPNSSGRTTPWPALPATGATCPTTACSAARSARARASARSRATTRTRCRWRSRPAATRCAAASGDRHADLRDHEPAVRREAERGDDRGGARPRPEPARARARQLDPHGARRAARGRGRGGGGRPRAGRGGGRGDRRARRRARERRRRRRRGVRHRPATRRRSRASSAAPRRPPRSSTSGACRPIPSRSSGRSASAPRRSARSRPTRRPARSRAPGSAPPTCARWCSTAPTRARSRSCPRRCASSPSRSRIRSRPRSGARAARTWACVLARTLDRANAGDRILVVSVADGCDARRARGDRADRERAAAARGRPLARREAQRPPLQHLPQVARHPALRAAAPARARAPGRSADAARRALEVRLHRLALRELRHRPPAAAARLREVRARSTR